MFSRLLILLVLLICSLSAQANGKILLRKAPESPQGQFVAQVLEIAYRELGYNVEFRDVSSTRELLWAEQNKLSGALARTQAIEAEFPGLVKVDFPLLQFDLVGVSNRRNCGYCLPENIQTIAYSRGAKLAKQYVGQISGEIESFEIVNDTALHQMIDKERVDQVLMMSFNVSAAHRNNPHLLLKPLLREIDYHYLSPAMAHLRQPLQDTLQQMEEDGVIASLQKNYQISGPQLSVPPAKNALRAISADWEDYTDADGSGVYWSMIDKVFSSEFNVQKSVTTWDRAVDHLQQLKADILVGAYRSDAPEGLYADLHIDYEYPLYVVAKSQQALDSFIAGDKDQLICLSAGMTTGAEHIPKDQLYLTHFEKCHELLEKERVQIFIDYEYNLYPPVNTYPRMVVREAEPLFVVFQNTPQGRYLQQMFDRKMTELQQQGELQKLFPDAETFQHAKITPVH